MEKQHKIKMGVLLCIAKVAALVAILFGRPSGGIGAGCGQTAYDELTVENSSSLIAESISALANKAAVLA